MPDVTHGSSVEWKTTVDNRDTVKSLRRLVTADKGDNHIVFVQGRGQIRPATEEEKAKAEDLIAVA